MDLAVIPHVFDSLHLFRSMPYDNASAFCYAMEEVQKNLVSFMDCGEIPADFLSYFSGHLTRPVEEVRLDLNQKLRQANDSKDECKKHELRIRVHLYIVKLVNMAVVAKMSETLTRKSTHDLATDANFAALRWTEKVVSEYREKVITACGRMWLPWSKTAALTRFDKITDRWTRIVTLVVDPKIVLPPIEPHEQIQIWANGGAVMEQIPKAYPRLAPRILSAIAIARGKLLKAPDASNFGVCTVFEPGFLEGTTDSEAERTAEKADCELIRSAEPPIDPAMAAEMVAFEMLDV